jgi:alcohol dehydrogenase (cytochrome c)
VKRTDPQKIPDRSRIVSMCPHADGAKNWIPSAYNPQTKVLFVPLMEICMDLIPVPEGESGALSTGVRWTARPPANSDGRYGRVEAVNLETGKVVWMHRQRAPRTSGLLATAGGVVFGGDLDRFFTAYDQDTGEVVWQQRLNDVSNAAPITFTVNGKQYLGVTVGHGILSIARRSLVPEIRLPAAPAPTLWVFEVP